MAATNGPGNHLWQSKLVPLSLSLSPQLKVQCHSKNRATYRMTRGSATTDHQFAYFTPDGSNSVYQYEWSTDQWSRKELPSCPCENSGLVIIDGELTAVGGYIYSSGRLSNKLFTLRQRKWVEEYPPMKIAQTSPAVVSASDGDYIIVIVGRGRDGDWTTAVELFQVKTRRWYETMKLPQPLPRPSATVCGDQVHVISGLDYSGYSCSLQALPSSDQPITSQSLSHLLPWNPLPPLPVIESTAATLCGQLVIIGGRRDWSPVNSIHQLVEGQWMEIGSMTSSRWWCLSVSPSPDKLIIVGGGGALGSFEECTIAR